MVSKYFDRSASTNILCSRCTKADALSGSRPARSASPITIRIGVEIRLEDRPPAPAWRQSAQPGPEWSVSERPFPAAGFGIVTFALVLADTSSYAVPPERQPTTPPALASRFPERATIHARRSLIGFHQLRSVGQNVLPDLVVEQVEVVGRFCLRLKVQLSLRIRSESVFPGSSPILSSSSSKPHQK